MTTHSKPLSELLKSFALSLANHGIDSPLRDAEELVAAALGIERQSLYLHYKWLVTEEEMRSCECLLKRRCRREPLQYILGSVSFFSLTLAVDRDVLIPRHETEDLVEKIVGELKGVPLEGKELWDIGTGSGCIGIALKKRFPELTVTLSDISEKALVCAKKNAVANGVAVSLLHGDLFTPFRGKKADFIVSNPPYITEEEIAYLQPEVRYYEPHSALVGGPKGTEYYEKISQSVTTYLYPRGKIFFEIGGTQAAYLLDIFSKQGFSDLRIFKDLNGVDRFFFLESHSSS